MNNTESRSAGFSPRRAAPHASGFTLIELMIAMTIFLIVGGTALSLFRSHTRLFAVQQNQAAINIGMRNGLSQMEMDIVNAGTGFYTAAPISSFPVGITVQNSAGAFDTLNVVAPDTTVPPAHPAGNAAGTSCANTTSGNIVLVPGASALVASQYAGAELLLMSGGTTTSGRNQMTTVVVLTSVTGPGANITLTTTTTNADGSNNPANVPNPDPAGLTTNDNTGIGELGVNFCPATDWVVKLGQPVKYTVNATNQLTRSQGGNTDLIADSIIGFKVGAATFNAAGASAGYSYANATYKADEIRSLRVSLIGRTAPNTDDPYRNTFDGGAYKIEALSTIINPRNLSMN
jgi:prepilin-type N-terminal cleavage/methylation domain-containing protein